MDDVAHGSAGDDGVEEGDAGLVEGGGREVVAEGGGAGQPSFSASRWEAGSDFLHGYEGEGFVDGVAGAVAGEEGAVAVGGVAEVERGVDGDEVVLHLADAARTDGLLTPFSEIRKRM